MSFTHWQSSRAAICALALVGGAVAATPASAQVDDARLRKIEAQIRALQRVVFPNGDGRFFTPEVITPSDTPSQSVGMPSETAVTDILARLGALEAQLARLTASSEENAHQLDQIEGRLALLEAAAAPPPVEQPTGVIPVPETDQPDASVAAPEPAAGPSPERLARVQAVAKPDTGDAGEDEYTYGFRLWDAGLYPEAQQQLKLFIEQYPDHPLISYGRNLLGRAYLDDGQPRVAAPYFLENYQADPMSARAPDSLLFLAEAMIALDDTPRACRALAEFGEKYPALAAGRLQDQYATDRGKVTCQ